MPAEPEGKLGNAGAKRIACRAIARLLGSRRAAAAAVLDVLKGLGRRGGLVLGLREFLLRRSASRIVLGDRDGTFELIHAVLLLFELALELVLLLLHRRDLRLVGNPLGLGRIGLVFEH